MRALDHLVLATRDLTRMADRFASLGFQVGSRNRHPWGTENHIIQFGTTFLELIGLADDYRSVGEDDAAFPFAGFLERYLAQHSGGIAMAVLRSDDATADAARLVSCGIGSGRMLPFSRSAQAPNRRDRTVAFTIAFAEAPGMPSAGFFTCEQHRPENFWNTAFQQHTNTAHEITGFTLLGPDLDEAGSFLSAFAGEPVQGVGAEERMIPVEGGSIRIANPSDLDFPMDLPLGPHIVSMRIMVRDTGAIESIQAAIGDGWAVTTDASEGLLTCWLADEPTFALTFEPPAPR